MDEMERQAGEGSVGRRTVFGARRFVTGIVLALRTAWVHHLRTAG